MKLANRRLIFHGEGDSIRGTGHLVRAVGLAAEVNQLIASKYLVESHTNNPSLVETLLHDWKNCSILATKNYLFNSLADHRWSQRQKEVFLETACNLPRTHAEEWLISDNKYPLIQSDIKELYSRYERLIFIDNSFCVNFKVDALIVPHEFSELSQAAAPLFSGPDWLWLNPSLDLVQVPSVPKYDYSIFMGGADPSGLTEQALDDLRRLQGNKRLKILVCIGPVNRRISEIKKLSKELNHFEIDIQTANGFVLSLLATANECLVAFGLTAIELEYLGKQVVLYSHDKTHELESEKYVTRHPCQSKLRSRWLSSDNNYMNLKRKVRPRVGRTFVETFKL